MHFTIGSVSGSNRDSNNFDLSQELKLVRTGLIYADHIELVSVGSSVLKSIYELRAKATMEIARLVTKYPYNLDDEKVEVLRRYVQSQTSRKKMKRREPENYKAILKVLPESQGQLVKLAEDFVESYDAEGFEEALNTGRLDLYRFEHTTVDGMLAAICEGDNWNPGGAVDDMVQEYSDKTITTLQKDSTYPLFDSEISNIIDRLIQEELILPTPSAVQHSKHGGLANDLFGRLPSFDTAPMDDIVDIRNELEESLGNFRETVAKYSKEIEAAQWSLEFAKEAERIFEERVKNSVDELEEEVRSNNDLKGYLKDVAAKAGPGALPSSIQAFIAEPGAIGHIVTAAWAGASAAGAAHKRHKKSESLKKNELYFYYRVGNLLQERR